MTMIAYRFALAGLVPRLAFLTSRVFFVLVSTLTVFMSMIEVVQPIYGQINEKYGTDHKLPANK